MTYADRVKDTTTSVGTSTITLSNVAPTGYQTFAAGLPASSTVPYCISSQSTAEWEVGNGVLLTSTTLSRSPTASSNAGGLVNFSAGTKDVFCTLPAAAYNALTAKSSIQVVYTSSTCISDADLSIGSVTFGTDQTAKLQAILDQAASGPLLVIWDGAYSVGASSSTTSLRIRSNTTIRALPGCGAIMRTNALVPMFRNYTPNVSVITDKNIKIEGGIWNGNGANQSSVSTAANGGIFLMDFVGVDGLTMTGDMQLLKCVAFAWHGANVKNVRVEAVTVDQGVGAVINSDGIHFNGPCSNITVRNVKLYNCADDGIAFNADDGYGAGGQYGPYQPSGAITDVVVDDITLNTIACGIRLLSGGSRIDRVAISNIHGYTGGYWLVIDNFVPAQTVVTGPGNIGAVSINNVCVDAYAYGGFTAAQASINCKIDQLTFGDVTRTKFSNSIYPTFLFGAKANIGQLSINRYKAYPFNGGTYLTDQITFVSGATVTSMSVSNCQFGAPSAVTGYPITVPSGVTIGQLTLVGNSGQFFSDFVLNAGAVTNSHISITSNFMDSATVTALSISGTAPAGSVGTAYSYTYNASGGTAPYTFSVFSGTLPAGLSLNASTGVLSGTPTTVATSTFVIRVTDNVAATANTASQSVSVTAATSTWALAAGFTEVSASALNFVGSGLVQVNWTKKTTPDAFGGNVKVSAQLAFSGTGPNFAGAIFARGSNTTTTGGASQNGYWMDAVVGSSGNSFRFVKVVGGAATVLGSLGTAAVTTYILTLTAKNGTQTGVIQRVSDGFYLNSVGTFVSGVQTAFSFTDTAIGATAGEYGVYGYGADNGFTENISFTNFTAVAAP